MKTRKSTPAAATPPPAEQPAVGPLLIVMDAPDEIARKAVMADMEVRGETEAVVLSVGKMSVVYEGKHVGVRKVAL